MGKPNRAPLNIATTDPETSITEQQLADLFSIAVITATQNRHQAKDWPPHFKVGGRAVRYRLRDVLAWRDARLVGKRP